jgi:hypothetical protein
MPALSPVGCICVRLQKGSHRELHIAISSDYRSEHRRWRCPKLHRPTRRR